MFSATSASLLPSSLIHQRSVRSLSAGIRRAWKSLQRSIVVNHHDTMPQFQCRIASMVKFLLWCMLLVLCWPLALLALVLYPIVWLLLIPFRLVGVAVRGVLELVWAIVTLPAL